METNSTLLSAKKARSIVKEKKKQTKKKYKNFVIDPVIINRIKESSEAGWKVTKIHFSEIKDLTFTIRKLSSLGYKVDQKKYNITIKW